MFFTFVTIFYLIVYPFTYLVLFFLFPYFFGQPPTRVSWRSVPSVVFIMLLSLLFFAISAAVPDEELSNRMLHVLAGGLTAFLVCFLAMRDSKVKITKFQFIVFGALMVIAMGVANEVVEFFGQNYTTLIFAQNINDTWLDLISNTVGIIIGTICLMPFFKNKDGIVKI